MHIVLNDGVRFIAETIDGRQAKKRAPYFITCGSMKAAQALADHLNGGHENEQTIECEDCVRHRHRLNERNKARR